MSTSVDYIVYKTIQQHLESAYPFEACGFLLGNETNRERIITASIAVENKSAENQQRRFIISPLDYLRTEKLALKEKLTLLGIYHSHPDHPAIPSVHDLEYAQPFFSYFIFSIQSGKLANTCSYHLINGRFVEEKFSVTAQTKPEIAVRVPLSGSRR